MEKTRLCLSVGAYSETPYCISGLQKRIHSIEELCFVINENAFLIDSGLMDEKLVEWIGSNLGLEDLARDLLTMVRNKSSLSSFVSLIMDYVGLYDESTVKHIDKVLKEGAGLSGLEKRKRQIDFMLNAGSILAAIKQYELLLEKCDEENRQSADFVDKIKAAVLHNEGVAYTRIFDYVKGGECFKKAYDYQPDPVHYKSYIACKKFSLTDREYLDFVAENSEGYEYSVWLEKNLVDLQVSFNSSDEREKVNRLLDLRIDKKQEYYEEIDKLTVRLKEMYRRDVAE
ncbi:MAG: hypothetical protein K6D96_07700 [Acetatifactor sp.]|nr:hypothetical protein [Acetatifactor sp.]